jgi:competence ComEA-like helix-hairpin-helix protein
MERARLGVWLSLFFLTICFALVAEAEATKKPPPKPININTANSDELQQVPGIGPATAEKILQMRKSYGAFKSVDDLLSIRGIGKKRLDKMRKYLTVSKSTSLDKPVTCPGCAKPGASQTKSPPAKNEPRPTPAPDPEEPPAGLTGNPGSAANVGGVSR